MVCFQTKIQIWEKLVGIFYDHILEYITAIWYILWPFGNLVAIGYISLRFGTLNKGKSGNPDLVWLRKMKCG
jgi:hypothetical protein